jgi:hypothetical protein
LNPEKLVLEHKSGAAIMPAAQEQLLKRAGVSSGVIKKLDTLLPGAKRPVMELALAKGRKDGLFATVIVNKNTKTILQVPKQYITNAMFLETIEKSGFDKMEGAQFTPFGQFGGMVKVHGQRVDTIPNEKFWGIETLVSGLEGIKSQTEIIREWCTNGATTSMFTGNIQFDGNLPVFLERLTRRMNTGFDWYTELVEMAQTTPARLDQVTKALEYASIVEGENTIAKDWQKYVDFDKRKDSRQAVVHTDLSVWGLYNSLTYMTTHMADKHGELNDFGDASAWLSGTQKWAEEVLGSAKKQTLVTPFGGLTDRSHYGANLN